MMYAKPIYTHDCETCISLGSFYDPERDQTLDLYWCINPSFRSLDSVIARYGNNGPEYISANPPEAFTDASSLLKRPWYREILERAKKQNLYSPYVEMPAVASSKTTNFIILEEEIVGNEPHGHKDICAVILNDREKAMQDLEAMSQENRGFFNYELQEWINGEYKNTYYVEYREESSIKKL